MFKVPENSRVRHGMMGSDSSYGTNGAFKVVHPNINTYFFNVIASCGMGWEHVSVSVDSSKVKVKRCPTWEEMCFIKGLFWDKMDSVVQFHPPESEYVNNHKYCLHLWRPTDQVIPIPDSILVGIKDSPLTDK